MNYRHAFHAGNFADVVKHVLLTLIVAYLQRKEKPFRVIDTHAGRGRYELGSEEALRTGEYLDGIARLLRATPSPDGEPLLASYLQTLAPERDGTRITAYPGSPLIVRRLLRPQDRLSAYELHPTDAAALGRLFAGDHQVKAIQLDGWLALGAHLPPKEKRGLVLIDPPFEQADEIRRIGEGLAKAYRRWPGGIYAIWYPLKRPAAREALVATLRDTGIEDIILAEFFREPFTSDERLVGTGLAVVNAPYTFAEEAAAAMKVLAVALDYGPAATSRVVSL
ncbi:23S rRNA (adenine(2030)-N(6))-methyltransferase RlmJ [Mangrovicella endophytica]|uniref:23S rRNA (adenine(2030)-N(6))-methyltransferase RlmJ n=1 Tax=Mangrovicella endophytica TaxID=2066697 RepID=UPI000C9DAA07|nr:23S rRNA (adenine(2030)-N(6))-methyltransferase RlmJ [Mangrovicella endophytica]